MASHMHCARACEMSPHNKTCLHAQSSHLVNAISSTNYAFIVGASIEAHIIISRASFSRH